MDEQIVSEVRDKCEQAVNNPGKFEGEARYVPYIYREMAKGCGKLLAAQSQGVSCVYKVDVRDEDIEYFSELEDVATVYLHEDNYGFVTEFTEDEAERAAKDINKSN